MTGWSSGCTGEVRNDTTAKSIPKKAQPTCSMSDTPPDLMDISTDVYDATTSPKYLYQNEL
jgi:hypothetical protein